MPQDAVDLEVGHQVCSAGQFGGVTEVEGNAGPDDALTATAAHRMVWTAACLAVG